MNSVKNRYVASISELRKYNFIIICRGYMAPEYVEYGEISTKSDVYSFGVLVIEIITGKKITHRQSLVAENLLTYVR